MPFPDLSDKKLPLEKQLNNGSNSYREKVREKIQNSPRSGHSTRQSIDLSLSRENTFFRPPSRLRVSSGKIENYEPSNLKSNSALIRDRQIIRYNQTYVPSAFDSSSINNEEVRIRDEPDLDNRVSVSRPASRESFYHDDKLKMRAKSSRREMKNLASDMFSNDNDRQNFEHTLTKSVNLFNSKSGSNINSENQFPIPKPRKRDILLEYDKNKQNLIDDPGDFKIKKGSQLNFNKAVTPRIGYIPTPTPRNRNQNDLGDSIKENSFLNNKDFRSSYDRSLININQKENELMRPKTSRSRSLNKINMAENTSFHSNESLAQNSQVFNKKDSSRMNN